jgi:outer membrane receptor protein involved in Fe transport
VEAKYDFGKGTYISGYYEYLSERSGPGFSMYRAYLMANVRLSRHLNFNADCEHVGGLNSWGPGDLRDDTSSSTLVNATLIVKKFLKGYEGLELRGSVYNLFDEDWSNYVSDLVPYGWPQPEINFLLEIKYIF